MSKRKLLTLMSLMLILALVVVACGGEEAEEPAPEGEGAEPTGTYLERARAGEFDGTEVNIFGAFVDNDARRFEASMVPFEEESGITINYEGSGDFETLINVRLEAGDEPDIAAHPQPGLLAGFVANGFVPVQVTEFIPMETLQSLYTQGWIDDSTFDGPDGGDFVAGVWYRASPKSFVWYPKDDFEAAGYEIPTTWDEMLALSDQIVADGGVPWCIGIESSGATGWVTTDWLEDIMLRTQPPE
ncbi:MAG: ABC transporter substrate-binding protein, partial [Candidatus Promineifilaceae bacterium]|nr:ABC transporter substrate-binding protein [Candidatus Promineifilaceae bacterium]